jgi:hypothetical protein
MAQELEHTYGRWAIIARAINRPLKGVGGRWHLLQEKAERERAAFNSNNTNVMMGVDNRQVQHQLQPQMQHQVPRIMMPQHMTMGGIGLHMESM